MEAPSGETLRLRFLLLLAGVVALFAFVLVVLDVPVDYDGCNDEQVTSDADVHSFRIAALTALGLFVCGLMVLFARSSGERQRRLGTGRAIGGYALALLVLIVPTLAVVLPLLLTGVLEDHRLWELEDLLAALLLPSLAAGAAGALLAIGVVAPAGVAAFAHPATSESRSQAETLILVLAGSLLAASPLAVLWIVYQGSGWVIGC